jgi:hypothetical protein
MNHLAPVSFRLCPNSKQRCLQPSQRQEQRVPQADKDGQNDSRGEASQRSVPNILHRLRRNRRSYQALVEPSPLLRATSRYDGRAQHRTLHTKLGIPRSFRLVRDGRAQTDIQSHTRATAPGRCPALRPVRPLSHRTSARRPHRRRSRLPWREEPARTPQAVSTRRKFAVYRGRDRQACAVKARRSGAQGMRIIRDRAAKSTSFTACDVPANVPGTRSVAGNRTTLACSASASAVHRAQSELGFTASSRHGTNRPALLQIPALAHWSSEQGSRRKRRDRVSGAI